MSLTQIDYTIRSNEDWRETLFLVAEGDEDIAATSTAISGGDDAGFAKENAFDNSQTTEWRSSQTGVGVTGAAYIGQDFGAGNDKAIGRFALKQSVGKVAEVKVDWSDDGTGWTTAATVTVAQDTALNTYDIGAQDKHRWWRLLANSDADDAGAWDVSEVELYEVTAIDLTGSSFEAHLRQPVEALSTALEASTANGKLVINTPATDGSFSWVLTAADISAIEPGDYEYDIVWTDAQGLIDTIIHGTFTIERGVTR